MHRRLLGFLAPAFMAVILAFSPGSALAQNADVITGRITRTDGSPISGVRVEVMSIELETTRSALTDANGRYMILFPDGGGIYLLRATFIGMADEVITLMREGNEELLLRNITMTPQAIAVAGITATGVGAAGSAGQTGEQTTELSQDLLNRLPLPDLDPATIAMMSAGVIGTGLDSISGMAGFSVGGMSELLNATMVDGVLMGEGGLMVPEEGIRRTQVTTSTFDVSMGGFAGGLVSMTSARGSNRAAGSLSYRFDDDALQMSSSAVTNGFRRQNFGGNWGGPIIQNKLFYNVSFQLQDNTNYRFALSADDPLAAQRSGVALDSVARFLNILQTQYGMNIQGQTGAYDQTSGDLRLSGRVDWNAVQRPTSSHTISTRFNLNVAGQDSTRISALDLSGRGGDTERNSNQFAVTVTSRLRTNWTHTLNASMNRSWNESIPYTELPEGRVRVTSEWEDGTRDSRTLTFGGNRNMPTEAKSLDYQFSNELSFLQPIGNQLHRLKVGTSFQMQESSSRSTDNLFGSFSFASLEDFAQNRADRYERSLTERVSETGRITTGIFFGDTWRVSQPLEVTLGLRWDYARLQQRPEYNPAVDAAFGRRTDVQPTASGISPRIGFSYRLTGGAAGGMAIPGMSQSITGGLGLFAGSAPTQVFQQAFRQTGLPTAEQNLICIGSAVPTPDWDLYLLDPMAAPTTCADGGMGIPPAFSNRAPNVTLLNPNQSLPSSLRADLGYRGMVMSRFPINVRYTYSLGLGLWGYEDLNLDAERFFLLGNEGRPFFGTPQGISARTGATTLATSRINPDFATVYDVVSNRRSSTHQVSTQFTGRFRDRTTLMANYTLGFSRDQGSAGGGLGRLGGGGMGSAPTAGNPNVAEWGVGSGDRRHTMNLTLTQVLHPTVEVAFISRISSGAPFSPMVDRDINGDGARNDLAFIFNPAMAPSLEIAEGMNAILANAPSRIVNCIESQLGTIAGRNSCRNGWTQSLDMRASIRPNLPRIDRRLTISIDATNVLTGLDQLVNGKDNMRGWGEGSNADNTLLYVRGFNTATNSFLYEVNENFGQNRRGTNALRTPFALRISARMTLGGQPGSGTRGFGQTGGFGGFGGGGGMAGMMMAFGGGGGGGGGGWGGQGGGQAGGLGAIMGAVMRGETPEPSAILDAVLPNPVRQIVTEQKDAVRITDEQVAQLTVIADELDAKFAPRRETLAPAVERLAATLASAGGAGGLGALQSLAPLQAELQPQLDAAQTETREALTRTQAVLSEEQWAALPPALRGAPQGGRGQGGGFNAVGTLDRMLANPIPVLLEFRDQVGMSEDQVKRIEAVSVDLDRRLNARREELGKRFDGVPAQQQIQVFQQIQPDIQRGREDVQAAMTQIRGILSPEQWAGLPEQIRNPPAPAAPGQGGQGGQRGGGGGGGTVTRGGGGGGGL
jgi:hypothetical protein